MRRALILATAGLCVTAAAHAQGLSKKYDWDDASKQSCMEPYAPAVPKPEETSLKELLEEVKPEIQSFIDESGKYLDCLSIQMNQAREDGDREKIKKLVKAHNDNVEYQKSVAGEFNATLKALKKKAGLTVAGDEPTDGQANEGANASDGAGNSGGAADGSGKDAGEAAEKEDPAKEKKEPSDS